MRLGISPTKDQYIIKDSQYLDPSTCTNGQYYHINDDNNRQLHVCVSGKNKTEF